MVALSETPKQENQSDRNTSAAPAPDPTFPTGPLGAIADVYATYYRGWSDMILRGLTVMTEPVADRIAMGIAPVQDPGPEMINIPKANVEDFNVSENEKEIVVTAGLPGFKDDEVDARIRQGRLTIKGERHQSHDSDELHLSFRREVPLGLPSRINTDESRTSYQCQMTWPRLRFGFSC